MFTVAHTGRLLIELETRFSSLDPHLELHVAERCLKEHHDRIEYAVKVGQKFWLKVRAGSEKGADDIKPGEERTGAYQLRLRLEKGKP